MTPTLIIGCGDIGQRVAALELSEGGHVTGLARSRESSNRLRLSGIEPLPGDLDDPSSLKDLPAKGVRLYYFAPPPPGGVDDTRMQALVSALTPPRLPERVVLISTTGVYGDCRGEWVTEEAAPNPGSDRARRRLSAENSLRDWGNSKGVAVMILRVPGIYGPGRLPEGRLREGHPVLREAEAPFTNRIHAEDLAQACLAAARWGKAGRIYNISDGHPTTMTDYFYRAADTLGIPRPPAITMEQARQELSDGMLSYLSESRRIDNRRMREELKVQLRYPDLERGLPACIKP